jgi:hypothetical protein
VTFITGQAAMQMLHFKQWSEVNPARAMSENSTFCIKAMDTSALS